MTSAVRHGGCYACGDTQAPTLWSTSDRKKVERAERRAAERLDRPRPTKLADSVALCPPCFEGLG